MAVQLFLFGNNSHFFVLSSPYRALFRSLFGSLKNERKQKKNHRSKLEWNAKISFSLTIELLRFLLHLLRNNILVIVNKSQQFEISRDEIHAIISLNKINQWHKFVLLVSMNWSVRMSEYFEIVHNEQVHGKLQYKIDCEFLNCLLLAFLFHWFTVLIWT